STTAATGPGRPPPTRSPAKRWRRRNPRSAHVRSTNRGRCGPRTFPAQPGSGPCRCRSGSRRSRDAIGGRGPAYSGLQIEQRVHRVTVDTNLEVEMRSGTEAAAADQPDDLAARDVRSDGDEDRALVRVEGGEGVAVVDHR